MTTLGAPGLSSVLSRLARLEGVVAQLQSRQNTTAAAPTEVQALLNFFTPQGSDMALAGQLVKAFAGPLDAFARGTTNERTGNDAAPQLISDPQLIADGHLFYDTTLGKMFQYKRTDTTVPRLHTNNWVGVGDPELHNVDNFITDYTENPKQHTRINGLELPDGTVNPSLQQIEAANPDSYTRFLLEAFLRHNLQVTLQNFPIWTTPYASPQISIPPRYSYKGTAQTLETYQGAPLTIQNLNSSGVPDVTNVTWYLNGAPHSSVNQTYGTITHHRIAPQEQAAALSWGGSAETWHPASRLSTFAAHAYTNPTVGSNFDLAPSPLIGAAGSNVPTYTPAYPAGNFVAVDEMASGAEFQRYAIPAVTSFSSTVVDAGAVITTMTNLVGTGNPFLGDQGTERTLEFPPLTNFPPSFSLIQPLTFTSHAVVPILKVTFNADWRRNAQGTAEDGVQYHPSVPKVDYADNIFHNEPGFPAVFEGAFDGSDKGPFTAPSNGTGTATVTQILFNTNASGSKRIGPGGCDRGATADTRKFMIQEQGSFMLCVPKLNGKWPTVYRAVTEQDVFNGYLGLAANNVFRRYPLTKVDESDPFGKADQAFNETGYNWNGVYYAIYDFNMEPDNQTQFKYMFFYDHNNGLATGVQNAKDEIAPFMALNAPVSGIPSDNW